MHLISQTVSHILGSGKINYFEILLFLPVFWLLISYLDRRNNAKFYNTQLLYSTITVLITMVVFNNWHYGTSSIYNSVEVDAIILTLPISFKLDSYGILLILLNNIMHWFMINNLPKAKSIEIEKRHIIYLLYVLQFSVNFTFCVNDLFWFFIFFEATLIPIFLLVLLWGSRERKVRASYLISIYTLLGSIFMLFNVIYILSKVGTTNYQYLLTLTFSESEQKFLFLTFFIAFAAKIPLFPLHIWLPEAHVEAPTIGSVLLAVIVLKLGTFGIIKFLLPLFPYGLVYYTPLIYTFAVFGIIYTCFTAIRQIDLKKIIAYSSVGHMNVVLLGIISLRLEGLEGAIFQMLSHGLVSGALFFCVGVLYDRYHVRSLKYFGGLTNVYPIFAIIFLIFSLANISFPGTSSFVGEFLILAGVFKESSIVVFFAAFSMILGAVYTLWAYNRIFFGNLKNLSIKSAVDLTRKEAYSFILLVIILLIMGVYSKFILDMLHVDCINLIEHTKQQLISY